MTIRVGGMNYPSFNSTNGIALEIYLSGCSRSPKCRNCHNPELWNFDNGIAIDIKEIVDIINRKRIDSVAIMGGEPLDNPRILDLLKAINANTNREVWLYTSYEIDEIDEETQSLCNYIKTGRYIEEFKTVDCRLASSNQQIYQIKEDGDVRLYYAYREIMSELCAQ